MSTEHLAESFSRRNWKMAAGALGSLVAIVLVVQIWAASNLLSRTEELRAILSTNRITANHLERRIGYGGLIHNFKAVRSIDDRLS